RDRHHGRPEAQPGRRQVQTAVAQSQLALRRAAGCRFAAARFGFLAVLGRLAAACLPPAAPALRRSASIRSTTLPAAAGGGARLTGLPACLARITSTSAAS